MADGHDQQQLFLDRRHRLQRRIVDGQRQQAQISGARPQLAHQARRAAGNDLDVDVGVPLPVVLQEGGKT